MTIWMPPMEAHPQGDRLYRLSTASLRINENLGFDPADVERL